MSRINSQRHKAKGMLIAASRTICTLNAPFDVSPRQSRDLPIGSHRLALPIEDRERNLTKYILARVCTINMCGYSKLLRSVQ